jgi:hypothetical protein
MIKRRKKHDGESVDVNRFLRHAAASLAGLVEHHQEARVRIPPREIVVHEGQTRYEYQAGTG